MKVKLLKQVRREFEILKVSSVRKGDSIMLDYYASVFPLPFYIIREHKLFTTKDTYVMTYGECLGILPKLIRDKYFNKIKRTKTVIKKVWH